MRYSCQRDELLLKTEELNTTVEKLQSALHTLQGLLGLGDLARPKSFSLSRHIQGGGGGGGAVNT